MDLRDVGAWGLTGKSRNGFRCCTLRQTRRVAFGDAGESIFIWTVEFKVTEA